MGPENQVAKTLEKPFYMVKKEIFLSETGTELTLGYIVVDSRGNQVAPSEEKVFTTRAFAEEVYTQLLEQHREMKKISASIKAHYEVRSQ